MLLKKRKRGKEKRLGLQGATGVGAGVVVGWARGVVR